MLETLKDLPVGIKGLKAIGKISKEDYEQTLEPLLDEARRGGRRLRFLYCIGPEFQGFTAGGAWEDAKVGRISRACSGTSVSSATITGR